jgi:hypothetical protein
MGEQIARGQVRWGLTEGSAFPGVGSAGVVGEQGEGGGGGAAGGQSAGGRILLPLYKKKRWPPRNVPRSTSGVGDWPPVLRRSARFASASAPPTTPSPDYGPLIYC